MLSGLILHRKSSVYILCPSVPNNRKGKAIADLTFAELKQLDIGALRGYTIRFSVQKPHWRNRSIEKYGRYSTIALWDTEHT